MVILHNKKSNEKSMCKDPKMLYLTKNGGINLKI